VIIELAKSAGLLLVLLNPFLVIIYLVDMVETLDRREFSQIMIRAGLIATAVFCGFAVLGDAIFSDVVQAQFASFQIFGGVVFLLIGLQFVFHGPTAIEILRGKSENLAGAVAMPVLIGPGTISASVVIGQRLNALSACAAVIAAVGFFVVVILLLKALHDFVRPRQASLVKRYIEIAGRIMALIVGTLSVEMIMQGMLTWSQRF
jgi:small neutral amino acid transporter SnatA (MarC family)